MRPGDLKRVNSTLSCKDNDIAQSIQEVTNSQGRYLASSARLDTIRDRITTKGRPGIAGGDATAGRGGRVSEGERAATARCGRFLRTVLNRRATGRERTTFSARADTVSRRRAGRIQCQGKIDKARFQELKIELPEPFHPLPIHKWRAYMKAHKEPRKRDRSPTPGGPSWALMGPS
jgi:hypothetical protein